MTTLDLEATPHRGVKHPLSWDKFFRRSRSTISHAQLEISPRDEVRSRSGLTSIDQRLLTELVIDDPAHPTPQRRRTFFTTNSTPGASTPPRRSRLGGLNRLSFIRADGQTAECAQQSPSGGQGRDPPSRIRAMWQTIQQHGITEVGRSAHHRSQPEPIGAARESHRQARCDVAGADAADDRSGARGGSSFRVHEPAGTGHQFRPPYDDAAECSRSDAEQPREPRHGAAPLLPGRRSAKRPERP